MTEWNNDDDALPVRVPATRTPTYYRSVPLAVRLGLAGVEGALVGVSIAGGVTAGYVAQIYCSGAAAQLSSHATAIASPHGLMIRRSPEPAVTPHDGLGVLVLGALAATALYRGLRAPVSKLKDVLVVEHMMPQESGYFQSVRNGLRGYPPPDTEN